MKLKKLSELVPISLVLKFPLSAQVDIDDDDIQQFLELRCIKYYEKPDSHLGRNHHGDL
jgi:hypothetical protein